ncbi:hypothetical protein BHE74_00022599 [Ensete ventricosum]|nr:hypothetical protein BHE74_00022599 [Ensete ventricosum]RZR90453.1 hypothetical protein BHM03_00018339 [Ensete ventricosum]
MPTQPLRGSVAKLFSRKFLRLRGRLEVDRAGGLYVAGHGMGLTAFESPPRRDSLNVFKPIIPLYGVSFKVDGSDVHHGSLRSPVITKVALRARKLSRRVSIFPSREVHPHACRCWIRHVFFFLWRVLYDLDYRLAAISSGSVIILI